MNNEVHPTCHCFDDAMEFLEVLVKDKQAFSDCSLLVVHSICLMPDGRPYTHAWVEDPKAGSCIFKGIINGEEMFLLAELKEFYENYKVQETIKYTLKQVCLENLRSGNFGPWEQKYITLTNKVNGNTKK